MCYLLKNVFQLTLIIFVFVYVPSCVNSLTVKFIRIFFSVLRVCIWWLLMRGWEGRLLHMENCTFAWETQQHGGEERHGTRVRRAAIWDSLSCLFIWVLTCFCTVNARQSTLTEVVIAFSCSSFENEIYERRSLCLCMHARMQSQLERWSSWNLLTMWLVHTGLFCGPSSIHTGCLMTLGDL